ncbi:MAG TPA: Na(+)-translocating NADH-quinone reductase subunit A [Burkholderiaceae bacterium]|nr:Na(+)-translocating NADH-quinone reductase subunit A [Burkholderiaceae bacterium]
MALHRITRGLDLPLAGAPGRAVENARAVRHVALLGADAPGLRLRPAVQPGEHVRRGQRLCADPKQPALQFTAPAAGTVAAVHRGERRALLSVVIEVDDEDGPAAQVAFATQPRDVRAADGAAVRALMLESGLWTAWRTRPFGRIPGEQAVPDAIFVTAHDTQPHAPDPQLVLAGREDDLQRGLAALERLAPCPVFLCVAPGSRLEPAPGGRTERHEFAGPHPAGTPGVHMHRLFPVGLGRSAWHIGAADVAALGHLLATGVLDVERVVALAGPAVRSPRLLRTRLGASIAELSAGELAGGELRVLSGSVLDGRAAMAPETAFLGRLHRQVSALHEGRERELFGWISPQPRKFSLWRVVAGHFARRGLALTTSANGGDRAMVPIGAYERVLPMDILATHLLRALAVGDAEAAVELGALELDEEDLALATFVCPGKTDWGPLLRRVLDRVEREGV